MLLQPLLRAPHRPRSLINAPTPTPRSCEYLKSPQISRDPPSSQIDFSSDEVQNQATYLPVARLQTLNTLPRPLLPAEHKHIELIPILRFLIKKRPVRPHGGHLVTSPSYATLFNTPYLEFGRDTLPNSPEIVSSSFSGNHPQPGQPTGSTLFLIKKRQYGCLSPELTKPAVAGSRVM